MLLRCSQNLLSLIFIDLYTRITNIYKQAPRNQIYFIIHCNRACGLPWPVYIVIVCLPLLFASYKLS